MENKIFKHQVYRGSFTVSPELLEDYYYLLGKHLEAHQTMINKKSVYIAGPMRGIADYNFPEFYRAEAMLDLWGFNAMNPARMDVTAGKAGYNRATGTVIPDNTFKIEEVLRRDFDAIKTCDAIVVLPGWRNSVGAQREIAFGQSIGIPVFEYSQDKPLDLDIQTPLALGIRVMITITGSEDDLPF